MKKSIIIVFLLITLFNLFLSYLNYQGSSSIELKSEILKYFTESDIANGESYARSGFTLSIIKIIIYAFMMLTMSFTGLSGKLELLCIRLAKNRLFLSSVYFIALLYFILTIVFLPFNYYFSYISEHKFGFSNMTMGFWFWTRAKSFFLVLPFISVTGSTALLIIKKFKFFSVLIVPAGGLIVGLVMMIIYPIAILPLFYDIKSIDNPHLEKKIIEFAGKSGVNVDKLYVIKESDYSNHTNAFFVGFGSNKKIYLYDTLIHNNSEPELISILAHETGHWKYNHNMKGVVAGFLLSLAGFLLIYHCVKKLQAESGFTIGEMHSPSMIPLYFLLFTVFSNITNPIQNIISRKMEMNADYYALEVTGDPDAFISSEIRIARDNRSRLNKHPLVAFIRNSHPMTIDRIRMAEEFKNTTKQGQGILQKKLL